MAEPQAFRLLFEHLPGIFFFVKDAGGRMIAASGPILERLGLSKERDIVGKTDNAFFPPEIAAAFRSDDQQVMHSGKPLVNRLEVWYDEQRVLDWFRKIAIEHGFCDQSAFTQQFRRRTGMTPRAFRKRHQR